MNVGVGDRDSSYESFALERAGGDDGVVEDAESLGPIGEGMMSAAREMNTDAIAQGGASGLRGGAGGVFASRNQFWRPGQAEPEDVAAIEFACFHSSEIIRIVREEELIGRRRDRPKKLGVWREIGLDLLTKESVFLAGKSMSWRERERTMVGGEDVQGNSGMRPSFQKNTRVL